MENKTARYLNWYYYGMLAATLIAGAVLYALLTKGQLAPIDPQSEGGKLLQYIVVFDILLTVPLGLYGFNRICKQLATIEDEQLKFARYKKWAALRILVVSSGMLLGIMAYYLTAGYKSMIWCAGIGAIAWYFTKPTAKKIYLELQPQDPNQETY
jgi:hypothetical protein